MDYVALFASAFLAATILPLASEVPLAILVRKHEAIGMLVVVATAGNFLGACTTYFLAKATSCRGSLAKRSRELAAQ